MPHLAHLQVLKAGMLRKELWQQQSSRPGLSTVAVDAADTLLAMPGYKEDLQHLAPLVIFMLPVMRLHSCLLCCGSCKFSNRVSCESLCLCRACLSGYPAEIGLTMRGHCMIVVLAELLRCAT